MSTIRTTNIQHENSEEPNIVLGADGSVTVPGPEVSSHAANKEYVDSLALDIGKGATVSGSNTSISSGSWATLDISTVSQDDASFADTANDRLLIPSGLNGWYVIGADVFVDGSSSGNLRAIRFYHNTSGLYQMDENTSTSNSFRLNISGPVYLQANDSIRLQGYHNVSGSHTFRVTRLSAVRFSE